MDFSLSLTLNRTKNKYVIKEILSNDELWKSITDDHADKDSFDIDIESDHWLLLSTEDELVGCYKVEKRNSSHIEVHTNILPKHRKERSIECGILLYKWILSHERIMKLTVTIPVTFSNVRDYCLHFGLCDEGLNKSSILKNGELLDQWIMGITREEISEVLDGFN